MPGKGLGLAAAELPWLCPNSASLITLAEKPQALGEAARSDPALLALLLRHGISTTHWQSPLLPEAAAVWLLQGPPAWRDPRQPFNQGLDRFLRQSSLLAKELARSSGLASADLAEWATLLAPLGWLAVASIDTDQADTLWKNTRDGDNLLARQRTAWGLDVNAIGRRLATRWNLFEPLRLIVGNLHLPLSAAASLMPDVALFAVVALAVRHVEQQGASWGLTPPAPQATRKLLEHLRLSEADLQAAWQSAVEQSASDESPRGKPAFSHPPALPEYSSQNPYHLILLPRMLRLAAESRRRNGVMHRLRLEEDVERYQQALDEQARTFEERVHQARLRGLAELAAGAGHEINNPLMVIVGHAQRLRAREADPERANALRTIERQAERIASLIKGLMQFARPSPPNFQRLPATDILQAVLEDLRVEAELRGVTISMEKPASDVWIEVDREQVRQALRAITRNAIEAVNEGGRVRLSIETDCSHVAFLVEDDGPGIPAEQQELIFDPFYSGRSAGRGRGLGLSIAWRLVEQNRGRITLDNASPGRTQIRLTLPRPVDWICERLSA